MRDKNHIKPARQTRHDMICRVSWSECTLSNTNLTKNKLFTLLFAGVCTSLFHGIITSFHKWNSDAWCKPLHLEDQLVPKNNNASKQVTSSKASTHDHCLVAANYTPKPSPSLAVKMAIIDPSSKLQHKMNRICKNFTIWPFLHGAPW
jgi:hypothetical protein